MRTKLPKRVKMITVVTNDGDYVMESDRKCLTRPRHGYKCESTEFVMTMERKCRFVCRTCCAPAPWVKIDPAKVKMIVGDTEGFSCPKCGSQNVRTHYNVKRFYSKEAEDSGDIGWTMNTKCFCANCGHTARANQYNNYL